jgi:hypothetical protein
MNNTAGRFLERMFYSLMSDGCDLNKLDKYFGWKDTERNIRNMSFVRDDHHPRCLHLTIQSKHREYDVLETYMNGIPRELNNIIYSYLFTVRELKYIINIPINYPFEEPKWVLKMYSENGKSRPYYEPDPNALYCGQDHSPSMHIDREILLYCTMISWFNRE